MERLPRPRAELPPLRFDPLADILAAMPAPDVVAVFGPTGIGKTATAIALADRLRAEGEDPVAVSADALQLYRGLGVLTGAADAGEQQRLEHRLVGVLPVTATSAAGAYARWAHAEIDALLAAGRRAIVVGGTGLYLRAALAELDLHPPGAPDRRAHWTAELRANGPRELHRVLADRHPAVAAAIAPTDAQRLVRSLELLDAGIEPAPRTGEASQLWTSDTRHRTRLFGIAMDRTLLYERIEARVEAMVAAGAVEEVRAADAAGASITARRALGFEELLRGDVEAMKLRTRRYAKRQLTWMRKLPGVQILDATGRTPEQVAAVIHAALRDASATPDRGAAAHPP